MESNSKEIFEFIPSYLTPKISFIGVIFFLATIIGAYVSNRNFNYLKKNQKKITSFKYLFIICFLLLFSIFLKNRDQFHPYLALLSYKNFIQERNEISKIDIKKTGDFKNITHDSTIYKETYVIIIGESTTRNHMGIYGYHRNTTPLLNARKDNLFVFNNVSAPHTHTIPSLKKSLTLNKDSESSYKFNHTLIQLFNKANFDTYFISNQPPLGIYETTITLISKTSNKKIFTNLNHSSYDQEILPPLSNVLASKSKKKLILIHLMGTHLNYAERYPQNYAFFKDQIPKTKFKHTKAYQTINEYDNAIRYNDFIINSIINEVEKENTKSYVLYFSDHGEDVYETINEACHTETKGTDPMYQIPFILWLSPKYKLDAHKYTWDTNRAYNNRDLFHTISDLSNINFKQFEPCKSIVNHNL